MTLSELQAKIKSASDKMRADDNTKNALKYLEQLTWLMFLKVFDSLEETREMVARIDGSAYTPLIAGKYRWASWARSRDLTGDELIVFVTDELLPYLRELSGSPRAERLAAIFAEVRTVMKSGYSLKEVVAIVDSIDFHALDNHHAMSVVYESLLAQTADAGWSGEFYTPRPVVESMVRIIDPKLGERIYDPCSGSAGFLVGSAQHLDGAARTVEEKDVFNSASFFGQESGEIAALVGTMNLILHGVEDPQIIRRNTLEQDARNVSPSEQFDVILTNPPFGGTENPQVQQNFPSKSAATELLFLQHCMAKLRDRGRAAIVLPDGILYRTETAFSTVRRRLLNEFTVSAIVRLPTGVFPTAADTRTNLIFFSKGGRTSTVRYYQVPTPPGKRSYSKTNPLTKDVLRGVEAWLVDGVPNEYSWEVDYDTIVDSGYDLDIPWPNASLITDGAVAGERIEALRARLGTLLDLTDALATAHGSLDSYPLVEAQPIGEWVVESGARAGRTEPDRFVGVSNEGGLAPFKGKPAKDTSRYRQLRPGDFVYNPMRVNVGSIALCRREDEAGWVSPDYAVFRLAEDAPFDEEFLLMFLKSEQGKAEIVRESRGAVRRRLYMDGVKKIRVPIPGDAESWSALIGSFASVRRHLRELPSTSAGTLAAFEAAAFGPRDIVDDTPQ
ncbi:N-6 DNA methylase [Microbacterium sp. JAI119]|uniref:N-6 DNA methylase n=1 Tax=Microbacterium sp. JAI119 TaxID=2723062 RepID=UPI0015C81A35|nr:N-6 DNA methylase [Microbacterium sp. JAI119]NYF28106.1 type I restriction enzyme M protein [Microbacterium sp. JAI119]